jgi:cyclopropane fatty-acyl-phospholipid synthase-like methyltransferase
MGLLEASAGAWTNTPLGHRTLVTNSATYQGHMILHNSSPALLARWALLGEHLGLPAERSGPDLRADHDLFLAAMVDTASAGQAAVLTAAVDLRYAHSVLDLGGGGGHYAIALCRAYPQLKATILDLPESERFAHALGQAAGMQQRVHFAAGDYRSAAALPGPMDAVLISNVLRGETPEMIARILIRAYAAVRPGGQVIVTDLFPEPPPGRAGLAAGMFLLHVWQGANPSLQGMAEAVAKAGFTVERVERFPRWVVMNGIVIGRRPPHD